MVIALLVGGVLVGQDLIEASKRRSVLTEWEQLETAVLTFKLKYNGLPGDLKNADDFFAGSTNGDGNRIIGLANGNFGHPSLGLEACRFFYHLSQSNLISGEYDTCPSGLMRIEDHAPSLPFEATSRYVVYNNYARSGSASGPHVILSVGRYNGSSPTGIGAAQATAMHVAGSSAAFTVEDTRWFDVKIDDGQARQGNLSLAWNGGQTALDSNYCVDTGASDEYDQSETRRFCHIRLRTNF